MREELRELWKFRELLFVMVQRELKIRYKNSVIGFFWSLLNPLVTVIVLGVVFKIVFQNSVPNYVAYLLIGVLSYGFFQQSVLDATSSITSSLDLIKKIYFPREIFPLALIISNFIHFCLSILVYLVYLTVVWLVFGRSGTFPIQWTTTLIPFVMVMQLCLITGVGLYFCALNVFHGDVKYFLSIGLFLGFYLCPIVYFSENVHSIEAPVAQQRIVHLAYHTNPAAMQILAYRQLILPPPQVPKPNVRTVDDKPIFLEPVRVDWRLILINAVISVGTFLLGYRKFNAMKWKFVERP